MLERYAEEIGVRPAGVAGGHIVAPPGDAELKAFVLIGKADPVADRLETNGDGERVFAPGGEIDDGGTVDRPVASESPARAQPDLLPVPKVFKEDVAIKSEITDGDVGLPGADRRSEEHTSELQSLMRISYAVFCLKKKNYNTI